jgi:hypothetical protein
MKTLRKFLYCCAILGALAFLGTTLLPVAANEPQSHIHGLPSGVGAFLQTAANQSAPATDRTIADLTFRLHTFSDTAALFIHRNVVNGRLQLAYMANAIHSNMSLASWLPRAGSGWFEGGPQVAIQNAGIKANDMAKKVPVVSTAINATSSKLSIVRNSLVSAAGF